MSIQKPYKLNITPGQPVFDSLPVAKITDYPLEKRDYRPFAQCILCVGGWDDPARAALHLRMWAFEVSPMPTSALGCVLYLYPDAPERAAAFWLEHQSGDDIAAGLQLLENGAESTIQPPFTAGERDSFLLRPHIGEDLQGVYWGMTLSLPVALLERMGGKTALYPGGVFPGNFYKTCADERFAHQGSHFPARFPNEPYVRGSMGEFRAVLY